MTTKKLIRKKFRDYVFKRDNFKCVLCKMYNETNCYEDKTLDAHHITPREEIQNGGYIKENGISLCKMHHILAESAIKNNLQNRYSPEELYKLIQSSKESAHEKSQKEISS